MRIRPTHWTHFRDPHFVWKDGQCILEYYDKLNHRWCHKKCDTLHQAELRLYNLMNQIHYIKITA